MKCLNGHWKCSLLGFHGLKVGKRLNRDVLDEGVEFVLGFLVFVSLAGDSHSDFVGDVSDAVDPDESVKVSVNLDNFGEHLLLGESLDVTDATGGSLLELNAVKHFVDVQGVVAAGGLHFSLSHLIVN